MDQVIFKENGDALFSETGSSLAADGWEKTKRAAIRNSVINLLQKKRIGDK